MRRQEGVSSDSTETGREPECAGREAGDEEREISGSVEHQYLSNTVTSEWESTRLGLLGELGKDLGNSHHQIHPRFIIDLKLRNRILHFQEEWFRDFSWLHYGRHLKGVLCFYCTKAFRDKRSPLVKNADSAFISSGFRNWKKALKRIAKHADCQLHIRQQCNLCLHGKSSKHTAIQCVEGTATGGKILFVEDSEDSADSGTSGFDI